MSYLIKTLLPVATALATSLSLSGPAVGNPVTATPDATYSGQLPNFTALVKKAAPAVVNISAVRDAPSRGLDDFSAFQQSLPEPFRRFFEEHSPVDRRGGRPSRGAESLRSLGSGFIISADGYVLTNAHVVRQADRVKVRLSDRRERDAKIIGIDEKTDIALIKIEADHLPVLTQGNSDALEVGEWVAAIGSPFGFDQSVTAGIVSATNRTLSTDESVPFIQTDVAINPGNSGGPLFNLKGEVVGINSQILTRSGGFMGLSFAIPINVAMSVADQLKQDGRVHRSWLGVGIQSLSDELAASFGLKATEGALVTEVEAKGPAGRAGVVPGDIILRLNDDKVDTANALPRLVERVRPGQEITLTLWRNGKEQALTLKTEERPGSAEQARARGERDTEQQQSRRLGMVVSALDARALKILGIDHGIYVNSVVDDGVADRAGIQTGDVLVEVNRQPISSPAELQQMLNRLSDQPDGVAVRVIRDGQARFVVLKMQ